MNRYSVNRFSSSLTPMMQMRHQPVNLMRNTWSIVQSTLFIKNNIQQQNHKNQRALLFHTTSNPLKNVSSYEYTRIVTSSDGKTTTHKVIKQTKTTDGKTRVSSTEKTTTIDSNPYILSSSYDTFYKEKDNKGDKSLIGAVLGGLGTLLALPFKIVFNLLGYAAISLFARRLFRNIESRIGKVLFVNLNFLSEEQKNLEKRLNALRANNQIADVTCHDDYIIMRAFRILQAHPLVHEVISKNMTAIHDRLESVAGQEDDSSSSFSFLSKISTKLSELKNKLSSTKSEDTSKRINYFNMMTDLENSSTIDKTILPNGEIICDRSFILVTVEDDAQYNSSKDIEKFKKELENLKSENPHLSKEELAEKLKLDYHLKGFSAYTVNVHAKRLNKEGAPYKIMSIEILEQVNNDVLLKLDQLLEENEEEQVENNKRKIIDAEVVEK